MSSAAIPPLKGAYFELLFDKISKSGDGGGSRVLVTRNPPRVKKFN